jgi:fucose permease
MGDIVEVGVMAFVFLAIASAIIQASPEVADYVMFVVGIFVVCIALLLAIDTMDLIHEP